MPTVLPTDKKRSSYKIQYVSATQYKLSIKKYAALRIYVDNRHIVLTSLYIDGKRHGEQLSSVQMAC